MAKIVVTVNLDNQVSQLTDEELGYMAEFVRQALEERRSEDEMEGVTDIGATVVR